MTTPCADCPFRSDVDPYLREGRVREIEAALERGEFHCHKTTACGEDGEAYSPPDAVNCAGSLILLMREGRPSQMMRIAERLGMFDPGGLDMEAPVYGSFDEMAEAMRKEERRRKRAGSGRSGRPAEAVIRRR